MSTLYSIRIGRKNCYKTREEIKNDLRNICREHNIEIKSEQELEDMTETIIFLIDDTRRRYKKLQT